MSRTSIELHPVLSNPQPIASQDISTASGTSVASLHTNASVHDAEPTPSGDNVTVQHEEISKSKTAIVITCITCITGISSLLNGLLTVGLPVIAEDLNLGEGLLLWPMSIFSLTCGCTFLLSGSLSDVLGARTLYLLGCLLQIAFTLGCGLSPTSTALLLFRALAGIAISFCWPSAVSIITSTFPSGQRRNVAFASMGGGQPIGFSIGLTVGGVVTDTVGWRWGFHVATIFMGVITGVAWWWLPVMGRREGEEEEEGRSAWTRVKEDIDWVGALIASSSLALMSYVFAAVTASTHSIREPLNVSLLSTSIALIPAFIFWVGRQERLGRPAIIPNSLWRNAVFTSICINVFLTWGAFNATETLMTFFFQEVQSLSAIQTSLRFLPAPVAGTLTNVVMGLIVHRVRADWVVYVGSGLSAVSPLLLAVVQPQWNYWSCLFFAVFTNAIGADTLFTISNLLITSVFPNKTQALAGGVFNTISQIGKTVGLATAALVASSATARSNIEDKHNPKALLEGYKAAWWYLFGLCALTLGVSLVGLRNIGRVGHKRD